MSSLVRNLPVLALAAAVAVSLYYVYRSMSMLNSRVDQLSQELYYSLDSMTTSKPSSPRSKKKGSVAVVTDAVPEGDDVVSSVDSEDIQINDAGLPPGPVERRLPVPAAAPQDDFESLQRYIKDAAEVSPEGGEAAPAATPRAAGEPNKSDGDDAGPDGGEDANDDDSDRGSIVSTLTSSKKYVPPFSAKSVDLGTVVEHNGKSWASTKTKAGAIRWCRV